MATDYVVRFSGQDNLSGTINKVKKSLEEAGGSTDKLDKIREKFQKIESSTAPLRRKLKDVKTEMEKLAASGDTSSDLFKEMASAAKQYQSALDKVNSSIKDVTDSSNKMNSGMNGLDLKGLANNVGSKTGLGNIGSMLGAIATPAGAATAAIAGTAVVLTKAAKAANEFEVSLDSLGALIGKSGAELDAYGDKAIELSKTYGKSATGILDAMGNIGSQAPQLLSDFDGMSKVTENAIVLAQAAGMETEEAASAITTVMNQMGVSASESTNLINVLAAAQAQGSASIEYLNSAIGKSGTVASMAGMSYVELVAAIEAIAPKFDSADQAGTALQSTLLKLASSGKNEFMPGVVGMQQALDNLAAAQLDEAAMTELVGQGNVKMLASLIENRDAYASFTSTITGTNAAFDQAAQKTDNFQGALDKFSAVWDAFLIKLGQSGFMQGIMDEIEAVFGLLGELFDALEGIMDAFSEIGGEGSKMINIAKIQIDLLAKAVKAVGIVVEVVVRIIVKAFNAITDVVKGVCNWIKDKWNALVNVLGNTKWGKWIGDAWVKIKNTIYNVINTAIGWWNDFMDLLGIDRAKINITLGSTPNTSEETHTAEGSTDVNDYTKTDPTKTGSGGGGSDKGGKGGKGGKGNTTKSTSTTKPKEEPEKNSQKYWENLINAENNYRQTHNLTTEQIEASNKKLEEYNKNLAEVKKALESPNNKTYLEQLDEQIKETQKSLKELDPNDVDFQQKSIELQAKLKIDEDAKKKFLQEIGEIAADPVKGSSAWIDKELSDKQAQLKLAVVGSDEWKQISKEIADLKDQQHTIDIQVNTDTVKSQFEIAAEAAEAYKAKMESISDIANSVGSAFSSLGGAIGGTGGAFLDMAGQTAQAIAQIIPQIVSLIAAQEAEALAGGTASAASLPFPANIAAIASIIATITALFAGFAGKFADGGIVGGGSLHGDRLLARVNSGEMILNGKQQANLFNALDGAGFNGNSGMQNVKFEISGSSLKGVLKNYDSKMSKIK